MLVVSDTARVTNFEYDSNNSCASLDGTRKLQLRLLEHRISTVEYKLSEI